MFRLFKRLTVAQQIFILAAALCVCVFSSMTAYVSISSEKSALRQTEAELQTQLKLVIDSMDFVYQGHMQRSVRNIATLKQLMNGEIVDVDEVYRRVPALGPGAIIVVNLSGRGDKDIFTVGKILGMGL